MNGRRQAAKIIVLKNLFVNKVKKVNLLQSFKLLTIDQALQTGEADKKGKDCKRKRKKIIIIH